MILGYFTADLNYVVFMSRFPEPKPAPEQMPFFWGGVAVNWPSWQLPTIAGLLLAGLMMGTPLLSLLQRTSTQNIALFDLSSVKASPGNLARATSRLLPDMIDMSDAVVIDSSPIGLTAEVLDLLPLADTIVMVIRLGHTLAATAQRTLEMLHSLSSANIHLALMADVAGQQPYYEYGGPSRKRP